MHEHMTSCIHSVFWGGISSPFLATISAKGVSNSICCGSSKLISDPMVGIRFLYCTLHSCLRYPQATTQLHWGYQLLSTGVLHTLWALTVMSQPYSMEGALLSIVPRNLHLLSICSTGDSCHIVAARAVRRQGQATAVLNPESPMQPPLAANWKTYPPSQKEGHCYSMGSRISVHQFPVYYFLIPILHRHRASSSSLARYKLSILCEVPGLESNPRNPFPPPPRLAIKEHLLFLGSHTCIKVLSGQRAMIVGTKCVVINLSES